MSKPRKVKKVSSGDPIRKTAVKILCTRLKEFYSHWPDPRVIPASTQLHNLRISGKRLRYSAEQLRELYPDRLALLVELLKRSQDLLGEIQDCVTQQAMIKAELSRLGRRKRSSAGLGSLNRLVVEYDQRRQALLTQFHNLWKSMAMTEFQESLKAMVSRISPKKIRREEGNGFQSSSISE